MHYSKTRKWFFYSINEESLIEQDVNEFHYLD